jgi:nucleotide-binding universal stress UspA family protein
MKTTMAKMELRAGNIQIGRVLCPIDLSQSQSAKNQLLVSWNLAKSCNAELDCLFVNPFYDMYAGYGPFLDGAVYSDVSQSVSPSDLIREDKKRMRALFESAGVPMDDPRVATECQVGPVFSTVKDWIGDDSSSKNVGPASGPQSMIVITKSETAGFSDFVLGSLATRIIRSSNLPCLVLPEGRVRSEWRPVNVLMGFALDNPSISEHEFVGALPQLGSKKLTMIHAFKRDPVLQAAESYRVATKQQGNDDLLYALIEDNIRHRLEAATEAVPPGFVERGLLFDHGKPEEVIFKACAASDPDETLLVLGRSVPATELGYLGSTLQHLVSAARIPVLVLPFSK